MLAAANLELVEKVGEMLPFINGIPLGKAWSYEVIQIINRGVAGGRQT